ncbi:site-specific DNA-methyltransferase [Candidatus Peregrinibacteria bacterium]|nr:site-specific DNA-methyltransferase [Candidatus Peregrinibacteria bacterium]
MQQTNALITIKEASRWASSFLERDVSESNISYLVQYGKVRKHNGGNSTYIDINDLKKYDHKDDFKKDVYFKAGDIILDPFSGSGTTLVQAHEMDIHAIGIDVSHFNCMITETKLLPYDFILLDDEAKKVKQTITNYEADSEITAFENDLMARMADFNNKYFPSPEFKYKVQSGQINENNYAAEKENEFLKIYNSLVKKYNIELNHFSAKNFLDKWYIKNIRREIDFAFEQIKKVKDVKNKKILAVILSRTIRSCRATTHSDLATLKEPQVTTYYCWKHKKICKPLFSIKEWFNRYATDTVYRLKTFAKLKTNSHYAVLPADSRTVDIFKEVERKNKKFHEILKKQKINGIFTSPPYVGQIDYHEQHAYAYDLFGFKRRDELEIGPLYKGQGVEARASYVEGISKVLLNCRKFLANDFDMFIVANDKYNLYPTIAEQVGMKIVNQFKRPVLNRTERDKSPYSETIFHLKNVK